VTEERDEYRCGGRACGSVAGGIVRDRWGKQERFPGRIGGGQVVAVGGSEADRGDRPPEVVSEFRVPGGDVRIRKRRVKRGEQAGVAIEIERLLRGEDASNAVPAEAGAFVIENGELGLVV